MSNSAVASLTKEIEFPNSRKGIRFLKKISREKLNFFVQLSNASPGYAGYEILGDKILLLNDPTAIQYILQKKNIEFGRSKYIRYLKYLFAGGIFLSDGENWHRQRVEAAPAFANGKFPEMAEQMMDTISGCFQRWQSNIDADQPVDMNLEMTSYALDVAVGSLFHQKRDALVNRMIDSLGILLRESETRIWSMLSIPQSISMKLPKYRKARAELKLMVDDLIAERMKNKDYPDDLLSRAIHGYESGQTNYKVLQDKVIAFLTSAHETSANSLLWALYEIAQRPEIYQKMREEIDTICPDGRITYEQTQKLPYIRQVFDEALRLYPSVWTMSRMASVNDHLPLKDGSNLRIEAGTTVMLCPYALHRLKEYWPNPLAFDPTRFTSENIRNRPKMSYIPFSGGSRLCLGFKFAQLEAVIALSMIVRDFDLSLVPGQKIFPEPNITLRPNGAVNFDIKRRRAATDNHLDFSQDVPDENSMQVCPFHHHKINSIPEAA